MVSQGSALAQVQLPQVGAGRYQIQMDALEPGSYAIGLSGTGPLNQDGFMERFGWAQSYSSEYKPLPDHQSVLPEIAFLAPPSVTANEVFAHNLRADSALRPIWQVFLTSAAILLVLDIASRRLILSRKDFVEGWLWLKRRFVLRRVQVRSEAKSVERISTLRKAKKRVQEQQPRTVDTEEPLIIAHKTEQRSQSNTPPEEEERPAEKSTAAILLSKKRNRD